jgi:hypothetical protein
VKTRESVDKRRFLLEVFHKVGLEWVVGEESKAQKIFGELLSDGEGRRCVGSAWVWRTKNRLALWPHKTLLGKGAEVPVHIPSNAPTAAAPV